MHWLADLILIVHFLLALFIAGGLPMIWIGATAGWGWVRDLRFRVAHLAAICCIVAEALLGIVCPLTAWEDALRGARSGETFVARWLRRLLYYDFPEWVFTTAYVLFALAVAATFRWVPPGRRAGRVSAPRDDAE